MQEFFGNVVCVIGIVAPFLEVEPRKYRFRIVNASNSRFYHLTLRPAGAAGRPNGEPAVHPMHLHLVQFQVINRQPFDAKTYFQNGKVVHTGIPMPPETSERVVARFDPPQGVAAKPGDEFRYVWHCHMLEHEDNEMMRPYKVVA